MEDFEGRKAVSGVLHVSKELFVKVENRGRVWTDD